VGKVVSTLVTVILAVGISAAIWVGANLMFNQVRERWVRFSALAFGTAGFLLGALIHGNRATRFWSEDAFRWMWFPRGELGLEELLAWLWFPLLAGLVFAMVGVVLATTQDPSRRLVIGTVFGAAIGVAIGLIIDDESLPAIDIGPALAWTAGVAVVGAGISALRKRPPWHGALIGAALGWVLGCWGLADLGEGSVGEAIIAAAVPTTLLGVRLGLTHNPNKQERINIDRRSRAVIFLAPAMLFILVTLVIPALRTIYLSFLDDGSDEYVGLKNYRDTFNDDNSLDTSNWENFFTSRLFWIGVPLLMIALFIGIVQKRRTGRAAEVGGPTVAPLLVGLFLLAFAAFTALRGTIINNLWWVVTVTFASTAMGLAIAVLADNAKGERIAKSLIFMPLAISLVGASVIWRFMYVPRDTTAEQTGVMNAAWVGLGKLSTGSGIPTIVVGVLVFLALVGLLMLIARALVRRQFTSLMVPVAGLFLLGWFFLRYISSSGVGGVERVDGVYVARTIGFIQESPYNNFWLMVILIWIQTGFAMVILSAAIKAVPTEYIEAARVDGATPSQIFWRVTLPQISTTIGVVVTTLVVLVMKVFDIVKVVTNGNFGTQVLANDMYANAFQFQNYGRGAALAVLILLSVLPVMILNIRRMQEDR
jgi:ABC-type sugar transport system permease subunit